MFRPDWRRFGWDVSAALLLLLLPLVIFLRHHDYPLGNPEVALLFGLVLPVGLLWGFLMNLGKMPGRLVGMVFLAVLVVDIQTTWITTLGLRLLLNTLFFTGLFWFLRRRLMPVVVVVGGAMLVGTLLAPAREQVQRNGSDPTGVSVNSDLPFLLHIILDEHIGIEGIPRRFDPDRQIAHLVRDSYAERGFRVFGRAYSQYFTTLNSLPNLLNFTTSSDPAALFSHYTSKGGKLTRNAWFGLLKDRGYQVHVIQPDYLYYDGQLGLSPQGGGDSSVTFTSESIHALVPVDLAVQDKARFILGSYMRLSFFLGQMRDSNGDLRRSGVGRSLGLPAWDQSGQALSTLSSMNAFGILGKDLEFAGPGRAFFVHLLVPHDPYAYGKDCGMLDPGDAWLDSTVDALGPLRNDDASRALRYPLYLDQLICINHTVQGFLDELSGQPWWDDAVVVIHGDHGSRISIMPPTVQFRGEITEQDLMDGYSTLFAIKSPGLTAGYDRRQLPIGHLFKRMVRDREDPSDPDLDQRPWVMIYDETNPMQEMDLPFFDHGLPQTPGTGDQ